MKAYRSNLFGSANMIAQYEEGSTVYFDDNLSFSGTCDQVTFTLTIRDGSANLIRTIGGTTYDVGTTGSLNMSTDIFGAVQSWSIPASGSAGHFTARLNCGSSGINDEYFETQFYVGGTALAGYPLPISGTSLSSNSITQNDYVVINCTCGTSSPDYAITTILKSDTVKCSKYMNCTGSACEVQFYPWEIGTCTNGTVQISIWDGANSGKDDSSKLTVANGTGSPESNFHQELLTCLRANSTLTSVFGTHNIDFARDADMVFDATKCPHIYILPDTTTSERVNIAEYQHTMSVGIVVIDHKFEYQNTDDILEFVQDYGNLIRNITKNYDWETSRVVAGKEGKTGEKFVNEEILYYYYLSLEAEVIV